MLIGGESPADPSDAISNTVVEYAQQVGMKKVSGMADGGVMGHALTLLVQEDCCSHLSTDFMVPAHHSLY